MQYFQPHVADFQPTCMICGTTGPGEATWMTYWNPPAHGACLSRIRDCTRLLLRVSQWEWKKNKTLSLAVAEGVNAVRCEVEKRYGLVALEVLLDRGEKERELLSLFHTVGAPAVARYLMPQGEPDLRPRL